MVFIPAGYNKLMKEAEFSGDEAKRLRELNVIAAAPDRSMIVPAALVTMPAEGEGYVRTPAPA